MNEGDIIAGGIALALVVAIVGWIWKSIEEVL